MSTPDGPIASRTRARTPVSAGSGATATPVSAKASPAAAGAGRVDLATPPPRASEKKKAGTPGPGSVQKNGFCSGQKSKDGVDSPCQRLCNADCCKDHVPFYCKALCAETEERCLSERIAGSIFCALHAEGSGVDEENVARSAAAAEPAEVPPSKVASSSAPSTPVRKVNGRVVCSGTRKDGKPCNSPIGLKEGRCRWHVPCRAVDEKTGERCGTNRVMGSWFCGDHTVMSFSGAKVKMVALEVKPGATEDEDPSTPDVSDDECECDSDDATADDATGIAKEEDHASKAAAGAGATRCSPPSAHKSARSRATVRSPGLSPRPATKVSFDL